MRSKDRLGDNIVTSPRLFFCLIYGHSTDSDIICSAEIIVFKNLEYFILYVVRTTTPTPEVGFLQTAPVRMRKLTLDCCSTILCVYHGTLKMRNSQEREWSLNMRTCLERARAQRIEPRRGE